MQVNKKTSPDEQRDLVRIYEAKQKADEQVARPFSLVKNSAENIVTDGVTESNMKMSVREKAARYKLAAIIVSSIAVTEIVVASSPSLIASAQSIPFLGENSSQFVLGTIAMLLCIWALITCEGFPYPLKNNESTLITLLALTMFFVDNTYRATVAGASSNYDELAVVAAAVLLERWLRLRKQKTEPFEMFPLSFLSRMKRTIFILTIAAAAIAFLLWLAVVSSETIPPIFVATSILLIASIEVPATAVRSVIGGAISSASFGGIKFGSFGAMMRAAGVDIVVFNGIETLANKTPEFSEVVAVGDLTVPGLLRLSAGLSTAAGMVYAESIMTAAREEAEIKIPSPKEFTIITGCGVEGIIETRSILLGDKQFMVERKIDTGQFRGIVEELSGAGRKIIYIATGNKIAGIMAFEFKPHANAKLLVDSIKKIGLKVALLTSENQRIADAIAKEVGVDLVYAIVQPAQRIEKISELRSRSLRVAVVGNQSGDNDDLVRTSDVFLSLGEKKLQRLEIGKANNDNIVEVKEDDIDFSPVFSISRAAIDGVRNKTTIFAGYNLVAILIAAGLLYPMFGIIVRPGIAALCMLGCSLLMLNSGQHIGQSFAFFADQRDNST